MKLNKYIWLAALPMAFTACQTDKLVEQSQEQGVYTLSCAMEGPDSRAQVMLGNQKDNVEYFQWNEGDKLNVIQLDAASTKLTQHEFAISADYSNDYPTRTADFTTTDALTAGNKFVALYPNVQLMEDYSDARVQLKLDKTITDYSDESWTEYFNKNMFMVGIGTVNAETLKTDVAFRHLCAMFRITYTNQTGKDKILKRIMSDATDSKLYQYCLFHEESDFWPQYWEHSKVELNMTNHVTVAAGESKDFYILFFPNTSCDYKDMMTKLGVTYSSGKDAYTPSYQETKNTELPVFAAGTRYWFKISDTDNGLVWDDTSQAQTVIIPNPEMSLALQAKYGEENVKLGANGYAMMSKEFADGIDYLNFNNSNLTSLDGVDAFVNLRELYCNKSSLTGSLKLFNRKLERLEIHSNDLTSVELQNLPALEYLDCSSNSRLKATINIQGTNLKEFIFHHTGAQWMPNVPTNIAAQLETLDSGDNELSSLNLTSYTSLKTLYLARNKFKNDKLILPENNQIETLDISGSKETLSTFDFSGCEKLKNLWVNENWFQTIDLSNCLELESLYCHTNEMDELDLTKNEKLTYIECGNQWFEPEIMTLKLPQSLQSNWETDWVKKENNKRVELDKSGSGNVETTVIIEKSELSAALLAVLGADKVTLNESGYAVMKGSDVDAVTELNFGMEPKNIPSLSGIEHFTNLTILHCVRAGVQECDLSKNTKLQYVYLFDNSLTSLDLSNQPDLLALQCGHNNNLSSLNLDNCTKLTEIGFESTALTSITIPNLANLTHLNYSNTNEQISFDLSKFKCLDGFFAVGKGLTSLNFSVDCKNTLTQLNVERNNLTSFNISEYPVLWSFHCGYNQITELDLTDARELGYFNCEGNYIKSLDITNTKLKDLSTTEWFTCGNQRNTDPLVLTLTDAQKATCTTEWTNANPNVVFFNDNPDEPDTEETVTIDDPSFAQELKNQFGDNVTLQDGKAIMLKSFVESKDELWFWNVQSLTSLEGIKNFTNLKKLVLVYHNVRSLDVSGLKSLKVLECWEGTLESLNITGCTALEELTCQKNKLLSLDLTSCTNITKLNCEDNKLTSLDMTGCTNGEIDLLCGNQGAKINEEITITVKLTEAMMDYWKKYLHDAGNNSVRVLIEGLEDSVVAPSIKKEEW